MIAGMGRVGETTPRAGFQIADVEPRDGAVPVAVDDAANDVEFALVNHGAGTAVAATFREGGAARPGVGGGVVNGDVIEGLFLRVFSGHGADQPGFFSQTTGWKWWTSTGGGAPCVHVLVAGSKISAGWMRRPPRG